MTKFNRAEWKNDKDWQRVLTMWTGKFYRTGLTLQALSAICDRPYQIILDEMLTASNPPGLATCGQVRAHIFYWQRRRKWNYPGWPSTQPPTALPEWWVTSRPIPQETLKMVRASCKEFPPPKYKGVRNWEAQTEFDFPVEEQRQLIACARGKVSPFRRRSNP